MLEKVLFRWESVGVVFIFILGTILHFVFSWSNNSRVVGLIAPVNESVWEHLKLVLWPALIYAAIEYITIRPSSVNFWISKTIGIYTAMFLILAMFYAYTAILGRHFLIIDILIFLFSIIIGQIITYRMMVSTHVPPILERFSAPILAVLIFAFLLFTYYPPHIPVFKNPIDGTYGI